ncbi:MULTISPECIES: dUTP diphosphatase [unclassified Bacillus (in: firmicutes)]|uniref:dUTP diphosphatase n=1 Tax=unclassified Bacillus (in: firmicutes) TaxID=185979 RepID=UPI0008E439CE|nr:MULTISPECIES: dUTP diphosphatase [unclassified Bacillus (in: firmicutes)]SFB17083.1 Dimeric dUTPase, all-alpha-NTP-PPase (MazG) superfamily [Bacillus sp. UNCCL13]SFQ77607.1 Dimeric dUTPase, all-alpha-NTP-PPase (MazG) superfamily [Bacillus sp. cl95]
MNLKKLYEMQMSLDTYIETTHNLIGEDLFNRKVLALIVELGELANETRCFKFWSLKGASENSVILEEFVDGVHFILSLGIVCGFETEHIKLNHGQGITNINEQFLDIFTIVGSFRLSKSESDYIQLFEKYMGLASSLGFSWEDIEEAYIRKNEVNYERQQKGY